MGAAPAETAARPRWRRVGEAVLAAYSICFAALFALTTLCVIVNFAWRQPMFDQWREYESFLGLPFPQNVIQLDNGHRPILPNFVRVAEMRWFAADQLLQIIVGAACAFGCAAILALCAWRERTLSLRRRAFGVLVAVLGVLWLGNARRLLHGSEALHGYLPTLFALGAVLLVHRVGSGRPAAAIAAATALCVLATFSFGLGLASFCAVLLLLVLLRRPWRELLLPAGALLVCLVLYTMVLPGNQGVREQLAFAPFEATVVLAQWLASPWKTGWLDLASGPIPVPNYATSAQPALAAAARFVTVDCGISADAFCVGAGLIGIAVLAACTVNVFRRGASASRLETLGAGAAVYAFVSGVLTVLARLPILRQLPDQIYADRYLLWPTLFWSGISLLLLAQLPPLRRPITRAAAALAALALPIALLVTQNSGAIWGALVYRVAENTAAAVRSGVYDPERFSGEAVGEEAHLREIAFLRDRRLAMFADTAWRRVGTPWTGALLERPGVQTDAHWLGTSRDPTASVPAGHLEGIVLQGIGKLRHHGQLVILTPDHVIAGLAEYSYLSPSLSALSLRIPSKRGFDGYVRDFDPQQHYILAAADFAADNAIELARLAPYTGSQAGDTGIPAATTAAGSAR